MRRSASNGRTSAAAIAAARSARDPVPGIRLGGAVPWDGIVRVPGRHHPCPRGHSRRCRHRRSGLRRELSYWQLVEYCGEPAYDSGMPAKRPRPRVRRTPEDARSHILDAADAVFRDQLPDAVGLREIAAAAEVSHGLVTHYFATYEGLVAAVIARRID